MALPFVLLVASVPSWLLGRAQRQGQQLREELGELGAAVVDTVQGTREILAAGAQQRTLDRIQAQHRGILKASIDHGRRSGVEQAATDALVALAVVATFAVAAVLAVDNAIPNAALPVAAVLATGAFAPLITAASASAGTTYASSPRTTCALSWPSCPRTCTCFTPPCGRTSAWPAPTPPISTSSGPPRRPVPPASSPRSPTDGKPWSANAVPASPADNANASPSPVLSCVTRRS
ncbi:MAG: hypothetical protein IRY85_09130 [Micromonosporaceae bacterium]|nr:hypothetical protein [Micromonosporaceae bacterium]